MSQSPLRRRIGEPARGARNRYFIWALSFAVLWTLAILLFALQLRYAIGFGWQDALERATLDRGPWALISPLIAGLAWWAHRTRASVFQTLGIHACGMVAALLLAEALTQGVFARFMLAERAGAPSPQERIEDWRGNGGTPPPPPPRGSEAAPSGPEPSDAREAPPRAPPWDTPKGPPPGSPHRPPPWDLPHRPPPRDLPHRPPPWDLPHRPPPRDAPHPPRPLDGPQRQGHPLPRDGFVQVAIAARADFQQARLPRHDAGRDGPRSHRDVQWRQTAVAARAKGPPSFPPPAAQPREVWPFALAAFRKGYNGIPLYLLIAALSHAFLFWRNLRERERRVSELEARLTMARADMLRLQLEPHFLFNTLNAIGTLVYRDAALADDLIARLSTLLRRLLDLRNEHSISIERELETVRAYVGIEQARFGERLRYEEDIAPEAREFPIPVLLLQPLVENAVRHGIEPLGRAGTLRIVAAMRSGALDILVEDDGVGMPRRGDGQAATGPAGFGIGLSSARLRLKALYGDSARVDVHPRLGGGTRIEIKVPKGRALGPQENTR